MKNVKSYVWLVVLCVMFSNCTTAIIDEGETPEVSNEVTYESVIQTIMFNHCITCHGGQFPTAALNLETYDNVKKSAELGGLLSRVENASNPMPPSGLLSATDRALIAQWAEEGFK